MSTPSRFNLSGLLIGIAILSVVLATGAYFVNGMFFALEAENNLLAYSRTAEALTAFVERHRRWPRDEAEFRQFEGMPTSRPGNRDEALARSIVNYDFDLSRETLDSPETFRGLEYRQPSYRSGGALLERLLATLREVRDGDLKASAPAGQAVPDDAEEASGGEEDGSREGGVPEDEAAAN